MATAPASESELKVPRHYEGHLNLDYSIGWRYKEWHYLHETLTVFADAPRVASGITGLTTTNGGVNENIASKDG